MTSKDAKKPIDSFPPLDTDIMKTVEKLMYGATHMQGILFRGFLRYNLENVRFLHHRLEEDLKTAEAFAKCTDFAELQKTGMAFCQRAVEEYSEEASKIANLGVDIANQTAEDVQAEAANSTVQ